MIKKIILENFFSFQSETIELDAHANVLVGINGSGKSNLLKALKLLQRVAAGGVRELIIDEWGGFDAMCYQAATTPDIRLEIIFDKDKISEYATYPKDVHYELKIHRTPQANYYISERLFQPVSDNDYIPYIKFSAGEGSIINSNGLDKQYKNLDGRESVLSMLFGLESPEYVLYIKKSIASIAVYDHFDTRRESKIRQAIFPTQDSRLFSNGSNLTQLLNTIKINDKNNYRKIIEKLKGINDNFIGIDFKQVGGSIELMLEEKGFNKSIHVSHISDGTLKFLCLLSIFFNKQRGKFVCIDEPELGLHPDMIHTLTSSIRETSNDTQYLITTHSDIVLDGFEIEKIRIFGKNDNNSTIVKSFTQKDFEGWYEEFEVGQMWRMGDIGGNRW